MNDTAREQIPMNTEIHRLLDELFAPIAMTPMAQDLKEEVRANLMARVAELETSGVSASMAAQQAIDELGPTDALFEDLDVPSPAAAGAGDAPLWEAALLHKVRPKPSFVVRVMLWSVAVAAGVALTALAAVGVLPLPVGALIVLMGVASTGAALLVGDSLSQETTANYPIPEKRAAGYALAAFLFVYGLGFALLAGFDVLPRWCLAFAVTALVGSVVLFGFLLATQTNRKKPWVRRYGQQMSARYAVESRFEKDPAAAARFGIYTAAIWVLVGAAALVLGLTAGWAWAPLPGIAGLATMLILLARMQFTAGK